MTGRSVYWQSYDRCGRRTPSAIGGGPRLTFAAAITDGTINDGITIAALCRASLAGVVTLQPPL